MFVKVIASQNWDVLGDSVYCQVLS